MKRRKGNREIKDHNGTIITDTTEEANILNSHYAFVFCCDSNISEIKLANSDDTFIISTKMVRIRLAKIGRNTSVGPDGVPGEILKLSGDAMTPNLATLREMSLNNTDTPNDWKVATVVSIYKAGDRSAVSNYTHIILNSVDCKQLEQVIAWYLRRVWVNNQYLYEGQHEFNRDTHVKVKS